MTYKEVFTKWIGKKYAESKAKNACHGSDSDDNAQIEGSFHFSEYERF